MAKASPDSLLERWKVLDPTGLAEQFDSWFAGVGNSDRWSHENCSGKLIPWHLCREAFMDPSWRGIANQRGVYMFGSDADGLIYVGMTGTSFRKRFRRYTGGSRSGFPKSQFYIASAYDSAIRKKGIDGIAPEVLTWYRKKFSKSNDVRLRHAVGLARRDLQNVWITIIEAKSMSRLEIKSVEDDLIVIAKDWNVSNGFGELLNERGGD